MGSRVFPMECTPYKVFKNNRIPRGKAIKRLAMLQIEKFNRRGCFVWEMCRTEDLLAEGQ